MEVLRLGLESRFQCRALGERQPGLAAAPPHPPTDGAKASGGQRPGGAREPGVTRFGHQPSVAMPGPFRIPVAEPRGGAVSSGDVRRAGRRLGRAHGRAGTGPLGLVECGDVVGGIGCGAAFFPATFTGRLSVRNAAVTPIVRNSGEYGVAAGQRADSGRRGGVGRRGRHDYRPRPACRARPIPVRIVTAVPPRELIDKEAADGTGRDGSTGRFRTQGTAGPSLRPPTHSAGARTAAAPAETRVITPPSETTTPMLSDS